MGLSLSTDVSHTTVANWEIKLDACLRASVAFHLAEYERGVDVLGGVAACCVRSDATNCKIWHQMSAHLAEYRCLYCIFDTDTSVDHVGTEYFGTKYLGDIQTVDDKTGAAVRRMLCHQSRSIKWPSWLDALRKRGLAPTHAPDGQPLTKLSHRLAEQWRRWLSSHDTPELAINAFVQVTDGGPDQVCCRNLIGTECLLSIFVWYFDNSCFQHGGHIGVRTSLKTCEWILRVLFECDVGGFSSLSKLCHIWRDEGKEYFAVATDEYGADVAVTLFKTAPPKCLPQCWGSSYASASRVLAVPPPTMVHVTRQVLEKKKARMRPERDVDPDNLSEIRDEEQAFYRVKHGRWGADTIRAICEDAWWVVQHLGQRARVVFDHLFKSQLKHHNDTYGYIAQLIWGTHATFTAEYAAMFSRHAWTSIFAMVTDASPRPLRDNIEHAVCIATINSYCEFHLRILQPLLQGDREILILAKHGPRVACDDRRAYCSRLFATPLDLLYPTALKVRIMFETELRACATHGRLDGQHGQKLYLAIDLVARLYTGDTGAIEGLNNTLKADLRRAPHTMMQLANSRLANKHQLGIISANGTHSRKYSQISSKVQGLLDEAESFFADADTVLNLENRWLTPKDAIDPPALPKLDRGRNPDIEKCASLQWAVDLNTAWFYTCVQGVHVGALAQTTAIALKGPPRAGADVFVAGTVLRRVGHMLKCTCIGSSTIKVCLPLDCMSSVAVMRQHWGDITFNKRVRLWSYNVRWEPREDTFYGTLSNGVELFDSNSDLDGLAAEVADDRSRQKRRPRSERDTDAVNVAAACASAAAVVAAGPGDADMHADAELDAALADMAGCEAVSNDGELQHASADDCLTRSEWHRLMQAAAADPSGFDAAVRHAAAAHPEFPIEDAALSALDGPPPPLPPPFDPPPPSPSPTILAAGFCSDWPAANKAGNDTWRDIAGLDAESIPIGGSLRQNTSVVEHEFHGGQCVSLVSWTSWVGELQGRMIDIDRDGRMVTLVGARNPVHPFERPRIVIRDTQSRGDRRLDKKLRADVPDLPSIHY